MSIQANKNLGLRYNVTIRVIDEISGKVVQEHKGHNTATNSMILGVAHYLAGDGVVGQGVNMLSQYIPYYMSLGTMGLDSQNADENGLPSGIGNIESFEEEDQAILDNLQSIIDDLQNQLDELACKCYKQGCSECFERCINEELREQIHQLESQLDEAKENYNSTYLEIRDKYEELAFADYMTQRPGYGADGYDRNENNGRPYAGLGWPWDGYNPYNKYEKDEVMSHRGTLYKTLESIDYADQELGEYNPWNQTQWAEVDAEYQPKNFELISPAFPRALISYRDVIPESESEFPETIDVVLSALISTGALQQFRDPDKTYVYITEAGLWSRPDFLSHSINEYDNYSINGNGLLAGYRIVPPNEENWYMVARNVPQYLIDKYREANPDSEESDEDIKKIIAKANRQILKKNIIRVGINQVVQVIWKIQVGSIDQFAKIEDLRSKYYNIPKE